MNRTIYFFFVVCTLALTNLVYSAPGFADGYDFKRIDPPGSIET